MAGGNNNRNGTNVYQKQSKNSETLTECMNQMWRVTHSGNGYYTIRPYHYTPAGLTASGYANYNTNADIYDIGYADYADFDANGDFHAGEGAPSYGLWHISNYVDNHGLFGTYFGLDLMGTGWSLQNYNGSVDNGNITIGDSYGGNEHKWTFERVEDPPQEILFYNYTTGERDRSPHRITQVNAHDRIFGDLRLVVSFSFVDHIDLASSEWYFEDETIGTISTTDYRLSSLNASGIARVLIDYDIDADNTYTGSFQLSILGDVGYNGTYYIQNAQSLRYLDIENQSMNNGTTIHQWSFHGAASSRWQIASVGEGSDYYTIRSLNSGLLNYYLAVENGSSADGARVVLQSGAQTDSMLWKIVPAGTGFKLIPKVGETTSEGRVMAVEYSAQQANLGLDAKSLIFSDDEYNSDKWYLHNLNDTIEDDLYNWGLISGDDFVSTDDGFVMITKPLEDFFVARGLTEMWYYGQDPTTKERVYSEESVEEYLNDWYLFSLNQKPSPTYGLLCLRTCTSRAGNKVTVSFFEFNEQILLECLTIATMNSQAMFDFGRNFSWVIGSFENIDDYYLKHSEDLVSYFAETESDAPYAIAEQYIKKLVSLNVNGFIEVPTAFQEIMRDEDDAHYLKKGVCTITENDPIYFANTSAIHIDDVNNPRMAEKCVILAAFAGDVNFHSFAAEVEYHAEKTIASARWRPITDISKKIYSKACRADMTTVEEYVKFGLNLSDFYDSYHHLDNKIVTKQRDAHPDYPFIGEDENND